MVRLQGRHGQQLLDVARTISKHNGFSFTIDGERESIRPGSAAVNNEQFTWLQFRSRKTPFGGVGRTIGKEKILQMHFFRSCIHHFHPIRMAAIGRLPNGAVA